MPNIATVLKDEMRRLAKREIKVNTSTTKGAVAQFRRDIAKLKRQMRAQEKKRLGQPEPVEEDELEGVRFSARSAKAQRERLGLSQQAYATLVGVLPTTIYNCEAGNSRPRKEPFAALVAVRGIGKREATARLEAMKSEKRAMTKTRRKPR
ncbi:MAG: helix-turn-helix domain-containing protein [Pirellulales bacterium]